MSRAASSTLAAIGLLLAALVWVFLLFPGHAQAKEVAGAGAAPDRQAIRLMLVRSSLEEARSDFRHALTWARTLQARLHASRARIEALEEAPPPTAVQHPDSASAPDALSTGGASSSAGTREMLATAYCLPGTTASGEPVQPGAIAVDPNQIALGTPLTVEGYGSGVALDTGADIGYDRIDVWYASCDQAKTWGARTVTVTIGG